MPLVAPAARLAKRPGAKAATIDQRRQPRGLPRIAALPARQRPVAHHDAVQRGERRLRRGLDAVGHHLLGGNVTGAQKAEAVDQLHLLERRAADQASVVELGRGERAGEPRFAAREPRDSALNEQACRHDAAPRGYPIQPCGCLVGVGIEVPGAAGERIQQCGPVPGISARQDVGRISGPEEDALAPQARRPGLVDPGAVGDQPAADDRFGQPRALLPRRRCREVAEPREALELLGDGAGSLRPRRSRGP